MAYREVTFVEVKEVIRQWLKGIGLKAISRGLGLDRNTVRRYVRAAEAEAIERGKFEPQQLDDTHVAAILARLNTKPERDRGSAWVMCVEHKPFIEEKLKDGLRLVKVQRLLNRQGVVLPYSTLHRFAASELEFGGAATSPPVDDCAPGAEVQVDTGWMRLTEPDESGKRRRFRAWIFTSVLTRHRFVYPCFRETVETAIEACEAAWQYFGGVFEVMIPDNTKAIVQRADPLTPQINAAFLEYAQSRDFVIDPARSKHPKDKARVERSVPDVREDCFAGEVLRTLEDAKARALHWTSKEYGMRRHTRTQRMPLEHFEAVEKSQLKPAPSGTYHVPKYSKPKVGPDQHVVIDKALYSLPREYKRKRVQARSDPWTVRIYFDSKLISTRTKLAPGGRDTDPAHFPPEQMAYAKRDTAFLRQQAAAHGEAIGRFADALLDVPMPWTRMRRVFALLGLCRRYRDDRVEEACRRALDAKMYDVRRLARMLEQAAPQAEKQTKAAPVISIARYLRDPRQFALPFGPNNSGGTNNNEGDESK
jgi:hypothetical protein